MAPRSARVTSSRTTSTGFPARPRSVRTRPSARYPDQRYVLWKSSPRAPIGACADGGFELALGTSIPRPARRLESLREGTFWPISQKVWTKEIQSLGSAAYVAGNLSSVCPWSWRAAVPRSRRRPCWFRRRGREGPRPSKQHELGLDETLRTMIRFCPHLLSRSTADHRACSPKVFVARAST